MSKNGTRLGISFFISGGKGYERWLPEVAYNSTNNNYLVIWIHRNNATTLCSLRGGIVPASGGPPASESTIESSASCPLDSERIALAYDSTDNSYLAVWNESKSDILERMSSSSGSPMGSQIGIYVGSAGNEGYYPALAYNRNRNEYLAVWYQLVSTNVNIFAQRLTGNGTKLPPTIDIATTSKDEYDLAVAAIRTSPNQGKYLVSWTLQSAFSDKDVWAQQVNGDGSLDGPPIDVRSGPEYQYQQAVAANNSSQEFLIAWEHSDSLGHFGVVQGRAFSLLGITPGVGDNLGGFQAYHISIAAGPGGKILIVYEDEAPGSLLSDIWGRLWGYSLYLPQVNQ